MTKEELQLSIQELTNAVNTSKQQIESANANHYALLGRLAQAQDYYAKYFPEEAPKEVEGEVV